MDQENELHLQELLAEEEIKAQLQSIPRTGWVKRGVTKPETVKEHTDSLVLLLDSLKEKIPELNHAHIRRMLQIHDWGESITGDIVTANIENDEERKDLELDKHQREEKAMKQICARFPIHGKEILSLERI